MKLLLAIILLAAVPAQAQAPRKSKVIVLDVKAAGSADPKVVEGLSSLVASQVARRGDLAAVGSADVRTILGFEKERQLLGCSDSSCLAEIGGALGADYLLSTEAASVGGSWLVSFALLDARRTKPVARTTRQADSDAKLVEVTIAGVNEVLDAVSTTRVAAHPRTDTLGWGLALGGGAAAGTGGLLLGLAWVTHGKDSYSLSEAKRAKTEAAVGVGLAIGGAALATWGVVRLLTQEKDPGALAAAPMLVPGTTGVVLAGKW